MKENSYWRLWKMEIGNRFGLVVKGKKTNFA